MKRNTLEEVKEELSLLITGMQLYLENLSNAEKIEFRRHVSKIYDYIERLIEIECRL